MESACDPSAGEHRNLKYLENTDRSCEFVLFVPSEPKKGSLLLFFSLNSYICVFEAALKKKKIADGLL